MTTAKEAVKKRTAILAELRKKNEDKVKIAQALLKEQRAARRTLKEVMQGESKSIPEIAEAAGMPAHEVLWHVTAMKKYGEVVEDGTDDDDEYFLYRLAKEA
jgi:DNA-directed RNA polymerase specialized sigma subunit